jgi:hypothetical protein
MGGLPVVGADDGAKFAAVQLSLDHPLGAGIVAGTHR